ncbi:hypothetical protein [Paraflavitalea sp. CAU 1676]|uniref:hypothetical protein n=1 Tax=Paraflavitalea sp. CAU 1676 TaxID=3032598 RepID=UPI0023DC8BAD|nr:hypothetical protein [Paraflavitalea sp. CAU 1676]MDF2189830.1 hypothetical protein [Paraflavitalea sp. CAU 1676]
MADIKRRSLILLNGKELKLFGNSIAINKSFQIGEGGTPNILSFTELPSEKTKPEKPKEPAAEGSEPQKKEPSRKSRITIFNPYNLTEEELFEVADFQIRIWVEFKDSLRRNGLTHKLFNSDTNG